MEVQYYQQQLINIFIYRAGYLPPFFEHKYRFVWSQLENVKSINQIKHKAVREMLKYFNIKDGLEITLRWRSYLQEAEWAPVLFLSLD